VKQSDLGEYEGNAREKQNIQYTGKSTSSPSNQGKSQAPPQTKPWRWQHQVSTQEGSKKSIRFLNAKDHTPPEPRQIKPSVKFNQRRQLPLKWRTQDFIK
jgi:hypothetical protein